VANLGEALLQILNLVEVVEFREVMSERPDTPLDVAIVEGSITRPQDVERIRRIRDRAKILVAYGSCATLGGINGMKNTQPLSEVRKAVYGKRAEYFPTQATQPLHQVVAVDYFVHGCPIYPPEFIMVLKRVLQGLPYDVPDHAVCVECKLNENVCMYEKGLTCLGPVTRAGCNSWCTNHGNICYGCRGLLTNPNEQGAKEVMEKYHVTHELIANKLTMYNACQKVGDHE
jgi:coenzyme F420-reducing hydrogenase gamma subunit